jgi:hypothetical protein
MKILLTSWYTEWRGKEPQVLKPETLPLDNDKVLFGLVVFVGNGEYDEACIETDSLQAREYIESLLCGTGDAKLVEPSSAAVSRRLYRAGYRIYLQGENSFFFVNPRQRPELFETGDLNKYLAEFKQV